MRPRDRSAALAARVGRLLVEHRRAVVGEWLARLEERLPAAPERIFPTEALLDHMPEVVAALGRALDTDRDQVRSPEVVEILRQLAKLRREQGYDVTEILDEFEILGHVVFSQVESWLAEEPSGTAADASRLTRRLYHDLLAISSVTAEHFRAASLADRRHRLHLLATFSNALAHELRNRLFAAHATLSTFTSGLARGRDPQVGIDRVKRSLERIAGVADDVQALAIAQGSEESARGRRRSLRSLVEDVLEELRPLAAERGVTTAALGPIPDLQVDAARVGLVLVNLIGNGVKYRDGEKSQSWVRVEVVGGDDSEGWTVAVRDNGLGIAPEMQQAVFDYFVRGEGGDRDGSGLGLAICREAVEQLGGRIWLESAPGEGTTIYFSLSGSAEDRGGVAAPADPPADAPAPA